LENLITFQRFTVSIFYIIRNCVGPAWRGVRRDLSRLSINFIRHLGVKQCLALLGRVEITSLASDNEFM